MARQQHPPVELSRRRPSYPTFDPDWPERGSAEWTDEHEREWQRRVREWSDRAHRTAAQRFGSPPGGGIRITGPRRRT